ncbi:6615_t:CDS:1, partial [Racocetra persica]
CIFADNDNQNLSERLLGSKQTNNRAKIYAVIRALEICENKTKPLEIMTDSKYVISIIEDWIERWKKNGYMSYNNKSIKNQELIKRLKKLIDNRIGIVKLVHVRGHLGNYGNKQADRLAKHGSLREAVTEISKLENNI